MMQRLYRSGTGGGFRTACLLLGMVLASRLAAMESRGVFSKGPYLQAPGPNTMTVMWESQTNCPALLSYGAHGVLGSSLKLGNPNPLLVITNYSVTNVTVAAKTNVTKIFITNVVFIYEATLTNLEPDTVYTYVAESAGTRAPPRTF